MPFIPVNLNEAKEPRPVGLGKYPLTIIACEEAKSKNQKDQYVVTLGIDGHDDAPPVKHYVSLPMVGDEATAATYKALLLKRFTDLFGVKVGNEGFDTTQLAMELVGRHATVELTMETEKDAEGNEKENARVFNRLQVPRLKDEGNSGAAAGRVAPMPPKR